MPQTQGESGEVRAHNVLILPPLCAITVRLEEEYRLNRAFDVSFLENGTLAFGSNGIFGDSDHKLDQRRNTKKEMDMARHSSVYYNCRIWDI
ncbi:MAG: hypothetical protein K6G60_03265 [Lachnospiraceae bacterium]|nr:hypothetical protein [Lachnospiraceae bacterium]